MILPSKSISPNRALLTISGVVFDELSEPKTVSSLWDLIRRRFADHPISYGWFILSVDLLFLMNLVWFDQVGLLHRARGTG
jgi:hypothetical protein